MSEIAFYQTLWGKVMPYDCREAEDDFGENKGHSPPPPIKVSEMPGQGDRQDETYANVNGPSPPDFTCCPLCGGDWNPKGGCKDCGSPIAVEIKLIERRTLLAVEADAARIHSAPRRCRQCGKNPPAGQEESLCEECSAKLYQDEERLNRSSVGWRDRFRTELRSFLLECNADKEAIDATPHRFLKALEEMTKGYSDDPEEILSKQFDANSDEIIMVRGIEFTSLCEHHLLPFVGTADVGYLPPENGKVVGLSKIARLVDCFAKRLQLQERMTREIGSALMEYLHAKGAAVIVRAKHACMGCRGVQKPDAEMVTSCMLGLFRTDPTVRAEFLMLCGRGRGS